MTTPESVYSRPDMIRALVAHYRLSGNPVISNVRLGDLEFDVLTFDKSESKFVAVECMFGGQPKTLAEHFSRANSDFAVAKYGALQFHALAGKGKSKKGPAWPNTAKLKLGIRFSVSVALMNKVCKRVDLLRSLKQEFPAIGIVRVKMNGQCRDYIRDRNGDKDVALTASKAVKIGA